MSWLLKERKEADLNTFWLWCLFPPPPSSSEQLLATRVSRSIRCPGFDLLFYSAGSHLDSSVLLSLMGNLPVGSRGLEERFLFNIFTGFQLQPDDSQKIFFELVHTCGMLVKNREALVRELVVYLKCQLTNLRVIWALTRFLILFSDRTGTQASIK